jgi:hypothetical protein
MPDCCVLLAAEASNATVATIDDRLVEQPKTAISLSSDADGA